MSVLFLSPVRDLYTLFFPWFTYFQDSSISEKLLSCRRRCLKTQLFVIPYNFTFNLSFYLYVAGRKSEIATGFAFQAPLMLHSSVCCKQNHVHALLLTFPKSLLVFWGRVGGSRGGVNFLLVPFVLIWVLRANSDSQFTCLLLNFSCLLQQSPREVLSIFLGKAACSLRVALKKIKTCIFVKTIRAPALKPWDLFSF